MTATSKEDTAEPSEAMKSPGTLAEEILASRESLSPELRAKQLRLLQILGERKNQPLPVDGTIAETRGELPQPKSRIRGG